ncbi:HNH endonuclease [Rahnella aceris]|uniref:HNH endonuclease n=1 Tax=Rahnella sp. (strain Y9602) TaxID=2703885 RepID=UPI003FD22926
MENNKEWLDYIIDALASHNGIAKLKDIYQHVEANKSVLSVQYQAVIRYYLESNSSDSDSFKGKRDLFYMVQGKGKGIWGLRNAIILDDGNSLKEFDSKKDKDDIQTDFICQIKARKVQSKFRNALIKKYNSTCLITGIEVPSMLIASHIKPWCYSDNTERCDENNGLLLAVHIDVLFDRGMISFDDNGILIKKPGMVNVFNKFLIETNSITLNDEMKKYMNYHRTLHSF